MIENYHNPFDISQSNDASVTNPNALLGIFNKNEPSTKVSPIVVQNQRKKWGENAIKLPEDAKEEDDGSNYSSDQFE